MSDAADARTAEALRAAAIKAAECGPGAIALVFRSRGCRVLFAVAIFGLLAHRTWLFLMSGLTGLLPAYAPVTLFLAATLSLLAILVANRGLREGWMR